MCSRILVFCSKFYCNNCGGPPTMPKKNRGPWSKKFENRCSRPPIPHFPPVTKSWRRHCFLVPAHPGSPGQRVCVCGEGKICVFCKTSARYLAEMLQQKRTRKSYCNNYLWTLYRERVQVHQAHPVIVGCLSRAPILFDWENVTSY